MPDIFLSYNREDQATARRFAEAFTAEGFDVWWDTTLRAGEAYDEVTESALNEAKAVVVLWSPRSVVSRWVRAEATQADRNKTLVPVTIEACKRPIMFELTQTAELSHWQGAPTDAAWLAFLTDVRRFVSSGVPAAVPAPPHAPPLVSRQPDRLSICVLPFANMSGDAEQEYFADGISEDIITDLSQVSALSVIARNTAFTFKGRSVAIREVARELEVTHVLEGSVRKAGNRVRITAQLIDGKAGDHVWAERFDRDLDDIFALQDEISGAIVKALKVKLLPEEQKAIGDRGTSSPEAYDLYLRARALSGQFSGESLQRALALLREAIALDPRFFQACQELVAALANYVTIAPEHAREALNEAREIEQRAVALAPNDPFVMAVRAQLLAQSGDYWNAERVMEQTPEAFRRRLAPNAQFSVSFVGRFEEALRTYRERVQLDPLDRQVSWTFRDLLDITGRLEEAAAENERSKDLPGARGFIELCALLRMKGRATAEELEAQYQIFMACRGPEERIPLFDQLAPVLLDPAAARALVRGAIADPAYQDVTRMVWLSLLAGFYDATDEALAAIRRAYVELDPVPHLLRFMWMPVLSTARKDVRFRAIVRDLGLYDYWRKSGKWGDVARPVGDDDFEIIG